MTRYRLFADDASLVAAERALWTAYAAHVRNLRGLRAGTSLDVQPRRRGAPSVAPATTIRYADPVVATGEAGGVLAYDDAAQAFAPALTTGSVEPVNLAEPWRTRVLAREPALTQATRVR